MFLLTLKIMLEQIALRDTETQAC
uniref:Uncharacterized protein n=1 Tax=Anguilla anguilla TaxID=7936 RepID=A0A0E9VD22_ANGAN